MDPKTALNDFLAAGADAARGVIKNSQAVGKAMMTSLDIAQRAGEDVIAGNLDAEGAGRVAQRGFDQLKTAATAEGNLTAAGITDWLGAAFKTLLKFLPIKIPG